MQDAKRFFEQIHTLNALPSLFPEKVVAFSFAKQIAASPVSPLLMATLHLWNDDLEACHHIVQQNDLPNENYLHAILHRREKDFSNSLYWFRRVRAHPVVQKLTSEDLRWTPESFVEACESFSAEKSPSEKQERELREWQANEMRLLFNHLLEQP